MAKKNKSKSWFAKQLKKVQQQLDLQEEKEEEISIDSTIGNAIPKKETIGTERYPDVYEDISPNEIIDFHQEDSAITLFCENGTALKIILLTNSIFRFRYSKDGLFGRDFSYAIDPDFHAESTPYIFENKKSKIRIQTQKLICEVTKSDLKVCMKDLKGTVINEDAQGFMSRQTLLKGTTKVQLTKKAPSDECFYGLGDKSCSLNLRGHQLVNYTSDTFGFGKNSDPLYRAIPFYFGLHSNIGYGIFFDNTYQTHFDFDKEKKGAMSFWADGGEMNYYFIYGPELLKVAEKYTNLTGRPELPPIWSLGFHQCRWSYYPDTRVEEVAAEFRSRSIPCDAIYLDIDYMDGYRCFTWNKALFPQPTKMISNLQKKGFHTVVMIDPGIKVDKDYFVYQEGISKDHFCRRSNGDLMQGPVWPPDCVWPDFTDPKVRSWWGNLYDTLYKSNGVSGFWNDMNEPALFQVHHKTFPDEVLHHYEGAITNHAKAHNVYGAQMSRATVEGLKTLKPEKRPFLVTRASYAGGQRFAAVWTGDNVASWEHLHIASTQCQRLSVSGFSFVGSDIGGFFQYPDGELMVRWLQLGIFHPFYRVHSMGNNDDGSAEVDAEKVKARDSLARLDQEPWAFGKKYTPLAKEAIEFRYQLLPYIYTTFWQYIKHGTPMIRQLAFYDQTDKNTYNREEEFLFGDHLLVHPVTEPKAKKRLIYLPKGVWYDYWTGEVHKGKQFIKYKVELSKIPVFVKAGAVIPFYPVMQFTNEKPVDTLQLKLYYSEEEKINTLYEDEGEGYKYQKGGYNLKSFTSKSKKNAFYFTCDSTGDYKTTYAKINLVIYGLPEKIKRCLIDKKEASFVKKGQVIQIELPAKFEHLQIFWK